MAKTQNNLLAGTAPYMASEPQKPLVRVRRGAATPARRFLSYDDLLARGIRFSRVHIRRMERAGQFPMHVTLGAGSAVQTLKAWLSDEVEEWEHVRIAQRDERLRLRIKQPDIGVPAA
jgi:predicted DNA-binding transcriptional regulator AlpA